MAEGTEFRSRCARDAAASGIGSDTYPAYLEAASLEHYAYFMERGDEERANLMLTQSLGEALVGNDGI